MGSLTGAVLFLQTPPSGIGLCDWYLKKITGVPFLMLNVLNLQRGGVERLVVYYRNLGPEDRQCLQGIADDPRINLQLEWASELKQLAKILQEESIRLLVNGSAVQSQTEVREVLGGGESSAKSSIYYISRHDTDRVAESLDDFEAVGWRQLGVESPANALIGLAGRLETRVRELPDFKIQQRRLLKLGGLSHDSLMDRWVTRHVSRHFTRVLIVTPITPNQVTWLHMFVGLGAAWYFYQGQYTAGLVGGALLLISAWLDSTDGEIARLRFQESRFGGMFDIVADNIVHFAVFFAIGMGQAQATGQVMYQYLGGLAVLGSLICFLLMQSAIFKKRTGADAKALDDAALADQIANRDFIYFLFVMAVIDQLNIFIAVTAVGANVFAAYVAYKKFRPGLKAGGVTSNKSGGVSIDS